MSATKISRLAGTVRGSRIDTALAVLRALPHRAARSLEILISAAAANAVAKGCRDADTLVVSRLVVNGGPMRKRIRAKSRGMAYVERNRTSHVWCEVGRVVKPQ